MKRIYTFEASNNLSLTVEEKQPTEQVIVNLHHHNEVTQIEFNRQEFDSFCSLTWRLDHVIPVVEPPLLEVLC